MPYNRQEIEEFWQSWLDINRRAEELGDWGVMADHYEPDATYGWSYSPTDHFMANGREEIRNLALGTEMLGFQGWRYPYQAVILDDQTGHVFGLWRQLTKFESPDGKPYEIEGLGGSWFKYSGKRSWSWQRDLFDVGMATSVMMEIMKDRKGSPELAARIAAIQAGNQPGHYASWDALPAPLWPVSVIT